MSQIDVSRIYGEARRRSVVVWCLGAIWAIVTLGVGLFSVFAVIQFQNTTKEINDLKTKADNVLGRLEEMNNTVTKLGDIEQRSSFIVALNIQDKQLSGKPLTRSETVFLHDIMQISEANPRFVEQTLLLASRAYYQAEEAISSGKSLREIENLFRSSLDFYSRLHSKHPEDMDVAERFARAECLSGNPKLGLTLYSEVVKNTPDDRKKYSFLIRMGLAQIKARDYAGAVESFESAASLSQKIEWNVDPSTNIDQAMMRNSRERLRKSSEAGAVENIGIAYLGQENWKSAFDNSNRVLNISDEMVWNWLVRSIAAEKLDSESIAKSAYDEWRSKTRDRDTAEIRFYLPDKLEKYAEPSPAATNGQQIHFHGPRGTSQVKVTGTNQNNIRDTCTVNADADGNAFTQKCWFKGNVDIEYTVNGSTKSTKCAVSGFGNQTHDCY